MSITYVHENTVYNVEALVPEGQKAFQLLLAAEQDVRGLEDRVVIAQAAAVALHAKVQEFLTEEAIVTEEEPEPEED
jgi:hypothetical protein|tara:strand:+ start:421 stop:651 length:231 start_codon:yes stop_codon:yes gene_type:complete